MKPIINPWLFYLIDKAEAISAPLLIIGIVFWAVNIYIYFVASASDDDVDRKWAINFIKKTKLMRILLTIGLIIAMLLPSKETSYKILTAYMVTPNNITAAGETAENIIDYIVESVDTLLEKEDE